MILSSIVRHLHLSEILLTDECSLGLSHIPGSSTVINNAGNTFTDNSRQSVVDSSVITHDSSSTTVSFHGTGETLVLLLRLIDL